MLGAKKCVPNGPGMWLSWQRACLACAQPWPPSTALHESGMVVLAYNPRTQNIEAGRPGSLGCITIFRPAWAT